MRASADAWNTLLDMAENEAYDKIKMVHKAERDHSVRRLVPLVHRSLKIRSRRAGQDAHASQSTQARGDLAEHVEMWQDKIRRLEANGEELKLAPCSRSTR